MRACTQAKTHKATSNTDVSSCIGPPGICRSTGPSSHLSDFCWLVSSLHNSRLLTDLFCRLVSAAPFCWLCPSLDWPPALLCRLFSGTFLPLSTSVSWEILHVGPLCGFCAKTDKGISDWHPHQANKPMYATSFHFLLVHLYNLAVYGFKYLGAFLS